ncbi:MAG: thioredoxin domain-containing protein [Methanomicrobiales archaeon]|nr:thioredoxin domain-containing protein [Methanomicrobiales archaeon]NYT20209.1 thioredoxin domain-containing protein [Methanomicrobiales archaeon]
MDEETGTGRPKGGPNRLISEVSPYLLQHAYNPVDWYAWGDDAFAEARRKDRMVFLSIGYATCHWCHVMERESFGDPEVARVMNEHFIAIKVDREERPDLDQIYMAASQILTGSGGWPLNIILTPERKPFFAMTYIPRESRFGSPGIIDVLTGIATMWRDDREKLLASAQAVSRSLDTRPERGRSPQRTMLDAGFQDLLLRYDRVRGGFGPAPKFPLPHNLLFLLRYYRLKEEPKALDMVEKTLRSMALGGIRDQVGFGFHRYSTDADWLVPHFEKMLYDQALLVLAYSEAFQATGDRFFERVARETLDFVDREMTSTEGAFYSGQDADTAGEEGGYYLWTRAELGELLDPDTFRIATAAWHVTTPGNFLDPVTGERTGKNILHSTRTPDQIAARLKMTPEELDSVLSAARATLAGARRERGAPMTDDKILTDWNGLMIAACARASRVFSEPRYADRAGAASGFLLDRLQAGDGSLLHRYRNGQAGIAGQASDYAFLIFGLCELFMARSNTRDLSAACDLARIFDDRFRDSRHGGYFTTPAGQDDVIARRIDLYDGAIPSPNSVAFTSLLTLSHLTGDTVYEKRASDIGRLYSGPLSRSPAAYTFFLAGLGSVYGPSGEVVIVEGEGDGSGREMAAALNRRYLPFIVLIQKTPENREELSRLAPFTAVMDAPAGTSRAYACIRHTCLRPVTTAEELLDEVERR